MTPTNIALSVGVLIGVVLLVLNVREIRYLHGKQRRFRASLGHQSWLIDILTSNTTTTTIVAGVFLVLFVVRIIFGVQAWSVWVFLGGVLLLLLIPVLRGIYIRRHDL